MSTRTRTDRGRNNSTLLTVIVGGSEVKIDPNSIPKEDRKILHGTYGKTEINSPAIFEIGESVLFWPRSDKNFVVAMSKPVLGVTATEFLRMEGHSVTLKNN